MLLTYKSKGLSHVQFYNICIHFPKEAFFFFVPFMYALFMHKNSHMKPRKKVLQFPFNFNNFPGNKI